MQLNSSSDIGRRQAAPNTMIIITCRGIQHAHAPEVSAASSVLDGKSISAISLGVKVKLSEVSTDDDISSASFVSNFDVGWEETMLSEVGTPVSSLYSS